MAKIEVKIPVDLCQNKHIDWLILSIAHCGYSPYYNKDDKLVCFTGDSDELITEINNG